MFFVPKAKDKGLLGRRQINILVCVVPKFPDGGKGCSFYKTVKLLVISCAEDIMMWWQWNQCYEAGYYWLLLVPRNVFQLPLNLRKVASKDMVHFNWNTVHFGDRTGHLLTDTGVDNRYGTRNISPKMQIMGHIHRFWKMRKAVLLTSKVATGGHEIEIIPPPGGRRTNRSGHKFG